MIDPYNARKLDQELRDAGLLIEGCSSKGRIDWINPPTQAQLDTAAAILAAHDPTPPVDPLDALRAKRRAGQPLTEQEIRVVVDRLLGV